MAANPTTATAAAARLQGSSALRAAAAAPPLAPVLNVQPLASGTPAAAGAVVGTVGQTPTAGAAPALDTATLLRLLQAQQAAQQAQQQSFQRLIFTQQLTAVGALNTAKSTKRIQQIDTIRLISLAGIMLVLATYALFIYIRIRARYADLIAAIQQAMTQGYFSYPVSAWFIPLAYEYPLFAWLRFQNRSFPSAVVYAWYTQPYSASARAHFGDWLQKMFDYSQQNQDVSGAKVMCYVGQQYNIPQCLPACPGPSNSGTLDYATSMLTWGAQGGFIGSMIPGAPVTTLVGLGLGTAFGWFSSHQKSNNEQNLCGKSPSCAEAGGGARICS